MQRGRVRRAARRALTIKMRSPHSDLAQIGSGALGDGQGLVEWRRKHVLLDDCVADIVDVTQHIAEGGEIDGLEADADPDPRFVHLVAVPGVERRFDA